MVFGPEPQIKQKTKFSPFLTPPKLYYKSRVLNLLCYTCRDPSQASAKHRDQQEKQQSDL